MGIRFEIERDFVFVEVKLAAIELAIHVGIGEEDFGRAAFDDDVEDVGALQFVERLGRENHGGIVFPPGLERFDDVSLNAGVLQEHPGLVDEERLEYR